MGRTVTMTVTHCHTFLSISSAGYTLMPQQTEFKAGVQDFRFVITGDRARHGQTR